MDYEAIMKEGRVTAMREFFKLYGYSVTDTYLDWFYENYLGICKNMGHLHGNYKPLSESPFAEFALQIYALGH